MKTFLISLAMALVGVALAATAFFVFKPTILNWVGESSDKNTQVVSAITRTQEVALVTLGIEGIREKKTAGGQVLFLSIPNSRATFLRYSFDAKLGIDAKQVVIDERADGTFVITVPSFIVIGLDNQNVEIAAENNDVLSWTTPEIDTVEMVNTVFGDDLKADYLAKNDELLRDQARNFYTSIVTAIDPDVILEFEFAE